jgi:hypothetical protein
MRPVPLADWRRTTAYAAVAAVAVFPALVVVLHVAEPEFDPSWRLLSEYSLGGYGRLMDLAFLCLGFGSAALVVVLGTSVRSRGGRVGLGLLTLFAASVTLAALFPTDAVPDQRAGVSTPAGKVHNLCAVVAINTLPPAATLVGLGLRRDERWRTVRGRLLGVTLLVWLGYALLVGWIAAVVVPQGGNGPGSGLGWPNRFLMLAYCVWLLVVTSHAARLPTPERGQSVP